MRDESVFDVQIHENRRKREAKKGCQQISYRSRLLVENRNKTDFRPLYHPDEYLKQIGRLVSCALRRNSPALS